MSLKNVREIKITGNTYPARDEIKRLGGRWDKDDKCWKIDFTSHPLNTMTGRGKMDAKLKELSLIGCQISWG